MKLILWIKYLPVLFVLTCFIPAKRIEAYPGLVESTSSRTFTLLSQTYPTITRPQAVDLVNRWLQAKQKIFAPPFDRQLIDEFTTGELYADLIKSDGAIAWLKANQGYYRFGVQKIGVVRQFVAGPRQATLEVPVTEDRTLYRNHQVDPNQTDFSTRLIRYSLELVNGKWKIADYKSVPTSNLSSSDSSLSGLSAANYDRSMKIGYDAVKNKDYQTALISFRRALNERPSDPYAQQAISNVESFIHGASPGLANRDRRQTAAPWSKAPISASQAPVFLSQWRQAENRATCAALAPIALGAGQGATPRQAYFAGGWAIAYDKVGLPGRNPDGTACATCGRGAFGIAGTGSQADGSEYQGWPFSQKWTDGSHARYGLEGNVGPQYLAFLTIKGQRCLYNVWSFLGREHLEYLLEQLRFVQGT